MQANQKAAVKECIEELVRDIDLSPVFHYLESRDILSKDITDNIKRETVDENYQRLRLIQRLYVTTNAWEHLLAALRAAKQAYLADKLSETYSRLSKLKADFKNLIFPHTQKSSKVKTTNFVSQFNSGVRRVVTNRFPPILGNYMFQNINLQMFHRGK